MMSHDGFWDVPEELLAEETISTGGLAGAIAASMAKWTRKPADLYPTPVDCVYSLIPHLEELGVIEKGELILEPACADGQLSRALWACGYQTADFDLRPDCGFGVGGVDFLDRENGMFDEEGYRILLTNPPFSAALEFIKRGLEVAEVVVLLLKSNYYHTKNRRLFFEEFTPVYEFKLTWRPAFLEKERGKSPLMDCSWFVFVRGQSPEFTLTKPIERLVEPPWECNGL